MENKASVFDVLNALNCNEHTEKKGDLTYLSWSWAYASVMKEYPDMTYEVVKDENGRMYFADQFGIMCRTRVTIEGVTREMWLPVMDNNNKAMLDKPYTYKVYNKFKKQYEEKTCEAATMFDINKTIMRCLVKNFAVFGLGLYIYSGEDLPEDSNPTIPPLTLTEEEKSQLEIAIQEIKECKSEEELSAVANRWEGFYKVDAFVRAGQIKRQELINNAK